MHTYTKPPTADLTKVSATKLKTLWPIGSEGRWNLVTESPERSHKYAMPRLRGRWCKAVIDSIHHCTYNLPRIAIISQPIFPNYSDQSTYKAPLIPPIVGLELDPQLLAFLVQMASFEPQRFRGLRDVSVVLFQFLHDLCALKVQHPLRQ